MKVKGVSESELEAIAARLGFKLQNVRTEGKFTAFVLRMEMACAAEDKDRREAPHDTSPTYRKLGHNGRRTAAVCYHGHKAFMEQVFLRNPAAVIVTCMERYDGEQAFEAKHGAVGAYDDRKSVATYDRGASYQSMCEC